MASFLSLPLAPQTTTANTAATTGSSGNRTKKNKPINKNDKKALWEKFDIQSKRTFDI